MIYFKFLDIRAYFIAYIIISFFGLCIGSFLNVCIYRLPRGESLIKRNSHCTTCGTKIKVYDLVPVFSWLILRGKCRSCGEKISGRYPLVESLNWFAYLLVLTFVNGTLFDSVLNYAAHAITIALFFSALIVIGFIDYDTMEIYPSHLVFIVILAVVSALFTDVLSISQRIIGGLCISVPFFIIGEISAVIIKKKTGEKYRGIELGDTLLMLCAGLLIGTKCVCAGAVVGIFAAAIIGLINKAKGKDSKFAFGPFLAFGLVIGTIFGDNIIDWYLGLFKVPEVYSIIIR